MKNAEKLSPLANKQLKEFNKELKNHIVGTLVTLDGKSYEVKTYSKGNKGRVKRDGYIKVSENGEHVSITDTKGNKNHTLTLRKVEFESKRADLGNTTSSRYCSPLNYPKTLAFVSIVALAGYAAYRNPEVALELLEKAYQMLPAREALAEMASQAQVVAQTQLAAAAEAVSHYGAKAGAFIQTAYETAKPVIIDGANQAYEALPAKEAIWASVFQAKLYIGESLEVALKFLEVAYTALYYGGSALLETTASVAKNLTPSMETVNEFAKVIVEHTPYASQTPETILNGTQAITSMLHTAYGAVEPYFSA